MCKLTTEEIELIRDTKAKIKDLSEIQGKEKALLRQPHTKVVFVKDENTKFTGINAAGWLMSRTQVRAQEITKVLIEYNKMRGKPWDMYLGNSKE